MPTKQPISRRDEAVSGASAAAPSWAVGERDAMSERCGCIRTALELLNAELLN